jgi:FkbM family methyltransferase
MSGDMRSALTLSLARLLGHGVPFKGRERIIRMLASPERMPNKPFEVDFFGLRYSGNLSSYIDWRVYVFGSYEPAVLSFLEKAATTIRRSRSGPVVYWDIGANSGQHVLSMSRHADHICAFEPNPTVRSQLKRNIAINRLNSVDVHECALGHRQGMARLHVPTGANRGIGSLRYADGDTVPIEVAITTGDTMIAQGAPVPHIVKIDVEGFEPRVLAGMQGILHAHRPIVLMELADATRRDFVNTDGLRAALYPNAIIRGIDDGGLTEFDFATSVEIAVIPKEAAPFI